MNDRRFDTPESALLVVRHHEELIRQLQQRVRHLEKALDTRATPLWKRIVFRIDGWPSWPFVVAQPAWRPWRRWWRS